MIDRLIRRSEFAVEVEYSKSAFNLLHPDSNLHSAIASAFSPFCQLRANDIRIETNTLPLSNAYAVYDLDSLGGFARIGFDKAIIVLFDPHSDDATSLPPLFDISLKPIESFLKAVEATILDNSFASFHVQFMCHYELTNLSPAEHICQYVSPLTDDTNLVIGNAVTYHLAPKGPKTHSSIALDMSSESSDCVFARVSMSFNASEISTEEMLRSAIQHCRNLLVLVGLESKE